MTIQEAVRINLCYTCNFAGRLEKEKKPCNYHNLPGLNYLNIPDGMCALTDEEVEQRRREYDTDATGRFIVKSRSRRRK